jgi:5-methylcytosine-specific restriction endonuclease McrA
MLEKNETNVTSICQFASILNDDNKDAILPHVKGASWRDLERVARKFRPPVELRDRIVHVQAATPDGVQDMVFSQFLAPDEYADVFDEVRNLLPNGMGYGDIILTALREYRDRHSPVARQKRREKKESADLHSHQWERARRGEDKSTTAHSHHREDVPKIVRDFIFIRDGGQCAFVAPDGTRCQGRKGLQVDHIVPVANDGPIDMANLRLLCGGHNRLMAERIMGKHVMQPYWRNQ